MDDGGVDVRVGGEIEGPQGFVAREGGGFDAAFGAAAGPIVALGHEQFGEEAAVGHLVAGGGFGEIGELGSDSGQAQQPAGGIHCGVSGLFGQSSVATGHDPVPSARRRRSWS